MQIVNNCRWPKWFPEKKWYPVHSNQI